MVVLHTLAFASAALFANSAACAEVTTTVLLENDKVKVFEHRFQPGDENHNVPRNARVLRAMNAGTLQRIYPDGKTQNVEWKAGEVKFNPAIVGTGPQYTTKNVGQSELVLYLVEIK
jgi:hypothetical protein